MAAMLAAVDDSVGAILDEVERLGLAEDTCSFFMADNGPSRETRNWLDGTLDPYDGAAQENSKGISLAYMREECVFLVSCTGQEKSPEGRC